MMFKMIKQKIKKFSPAQIIVAYYIVAVTVSMILLSLPISIKPGAKWTFFDALFTAVSAVSVTGLTTVSIADTFTVPGIFILMFVLQFGGVGVMTLGTFFWLLLRKKIGLKERRLIMTDQNQSSLSGLVKLLKEILSIILFIEIVGALILGLHFLKYYPTWQEAFLHGLFASISATTNAGFDITRSSLIPFADDYFVQFINIILISLGAIGFPVLVETKDYLFHRHAHKFRFSLFTKLTTITYFSLLIFGTIAIFFIEFDQYFTDKQWHEAFFYSLFQSSTTRSAGLATMPIGDFSSSTVLLIAALMFIGASPSSVGGGIRTTTFALNILFLFHFAKGNRSIKLFNRELHNEDIMKSVVVSMVAMFTCFIAVLILTITEEHSLLAIVFEVSSAFGTNGLSLGITPDLSPVGKIVIMLMMFIGRVGVLSFLFMIGGKEQPERFHYPKERVIIG